MNLPDLIFLAELQTDSHRFEDSSQTLRLIAKERHGLLTAPERQLLYDSYKGLTGPLRQSLRKLDALVQLEESANHEARLRQAQRVQQSTRSRLQQVTQELLQLVDEVLLPAVDAAAKQQQQQQQQSASAAAAGESAESLAESRVFYLKLRGDYHRYRAEAMLPGKPRRDAAQHALVAYKVALVHGAQIPPASPLRLGLVLNAAVFYHEVLAAKSMARRLVESHLAQLQGLSGAAEAKDDPTANALLESLKNNLQLWKKEQMAADASVNALSQT